MPATPERGKVLLYDNRKSKADPNHPHHNPKGPDFSGLLTTPAGEVLELALWQRTSKKNGVPYVGGQVKPPRDQRTAPPAAAPAPPADPSTYSGPENPVGGDDSPF